MELATEALESGDEPFGSVLVAGDGTVLAEDHNRVASGDRTRHPEFGLARWAAGHLTPEERTVATVYTSGEHCPMCAAAHGWVGLGRIVYVASSGQLSAWLAELGVPPPPVRTLPIREVVPGLPSRARSPGSQTRSTTCTAASTWAPRSGATMPVQLNHTIVRVRDKRESATFLAEVLGVGPPTAFGPFLVVEVDNDVSLDFADDHGPVHPQHYAFLVGEGEFDQIFGRIRERGLPYWADPGRRRPGEINTNDGGRGVYWEEPSGHFLEIITRPYGSGG